MLAVHIYVMPWQPTITVDDLPTMRIGVVKPTNSCRICAPLALAARIKHYLFPIRVLGSHRFQSSKQQKNILFEFLRTCQLQSLCGSRTSAAVRGEIATAGPPRNLGGIRKALRVLQEGIVGERPFFKLRKTVFPFTFMAFHGNPQGRFHV